MSPPGELVLVATPIGNLADLSPRAAAELERAAVICCEDTRHTGLLLKRAGVAANRLMSLHAHNEASHLEEVLGLIEDGAVVAVVTDAGTPAVSDPGGRLVGAAHLAGVKVSIVPGPSAVTAAVALSGFPAPRWCFEGFVPTKGKERAERLQAVAGSEIPSVLYESPRRVERLLQELKALASPDRLVVVCRELTKLHEEVWRGPLSEAVRRWPAESAKGEFVLVVDGSRARDEPELSPDEVSEAVSELVAGGMSRRDAVDEVAARAQRSRREVYEVLERARRPTEDRL